MLSLEFHGITSADYERQIKKIYIQSADKLHCRRTGLTRQIKNLNLRCFVS